MQERRSFGWFVSQSLISSCGTTTPFLLEDIFCLDSTAMEKQLTSSKIENLYVNPAKIIKGQLFSLSLTTPKQDRIQIKKLLCVRFQGFWIELVVRTTHNYPFFCVAPIYVVLVYIREWVFMGQEKEVACSWAFDQIHEA